MTVAIPDLVAAHLGPTEKEVLIALACLLYDAGKLDMPLAQRLAGLGRTEFENALRSQGLDTYRPTEADFDADLEALRRPAP